MSTKAQVNGRASEAVNCVNDVGVEWEGRLRLV